MGEGGAAHGEVGVLEQHAALFRRLADAVHLQGVTDAGGAVVQGACEEGVQGVRAVEVHTGIAAA